MTDEKNNIISAVNISILNQSNGTTSDENGNYIWDIGENFVDTNGNEIYDDLGTEVCSSSNYTQTTCEAADGGTWSEGYMQDNNIPIFRIFDTTLIVKGTPY